MANHDYVIANQGFPSFRADLNDVLQAVVSNNSSASEPSTKYAYQMWYETDQNKWYMRNADNDAWILLAEFNQTNDTVNFIDSSGGVAGISTSASATVITLANGSVAINPAGFVSVGGAATQSGEVRFLEDTDNGSNYIALKPAAAISSNSTLTLPEATDTLVGKATTDTLTNKTLTSPKINEDVAVTSTATELNKLDALSRGSIIYGNASAATAVLTKGGAGTVLTSDGTDISWGSAAGRTGSVSWDTTVKTSGFTGANGVGYFCNTAGGAFTLTLPSSPSAGDIVGFKDYNGNFGTANLTIGRGGSKINGEDAANVVINTPGASIFLVYVDSTQGWVATQDDESVFAGQSFVVASGGTVTTCGADKIHTFTSPGTFTVNSVASTSANNIVSYMVVAGGGGTAKDRGGAAGAGGFREYKGPAQSYSASPLDGSPGGAGSGTAITVSAQGYPITIGAGGAADNTPPFSPGGGDGANSIFSSITSTGGGGGGDTGQNGRNGGSGGASGAGNSTVGTGNTPPTTPAQGRNGGVGGPSSGLVGNGGGGGATAVGTNGGDEDGGAGGAGATTTINGTSTAFAGGGGGGSDGAGGASGGVGGGGNGASGPYPGSSVAAENGTANTGGGAGGSNGGGASVCGKNGGSGIVIIRYRFQ